MNIDEALEQLEVGIKRLKVHYDMFFTGALKRQPYEQRRQVDQLIRSFSNTRIQKYHHRFQLNTLVGRYNTLCELWNKHLRAIEEGGRAALVGPFAPRAAAMQKEKSEQEQVVFSVRISDPDSEQDTMRILYERYLEARESNGHGAGQLKLESFIRQISRQAASLKDASGSDSIEFRVLLKGESVSLKARSGGSETP